jgi:hypothetical protein
MQNKAVISWRASRKSILLYFVAHTLTLQDPTKQSLHLITANLVNADVRKSNHISVWAQVILKSIEILFNFFESTRGSRFLRSFHHLNTQMPNMLHSCIAITFSKWNLLPAWKLGRMVNGSIINSLIRLSGQKRHDTSKHSHYITKLPTWIRQLMP